MGMQGEKCASNKTDIWASSLTMMKILAGDDAIKTAIKYVSLFHSIQLHMYVYYDFYSSLTSSLIPSVCIVVIMFLI